MYIIRVVQNYSADLIVAQYSHSDYSADPRVVHYSTDLRVEQDYSPDPRVVQNSHRDYSADPMVVEYSAD